MARHDELSRDLLFGLLTLQNGLVTRDQLVLTFARWTATPGGSLADALVEYGGLAPEHRSTLDSLVDAYLKLHGGDVEKSISSLDVNQSTLASVLQAAGIEVDSTITHVPSPPPADDEEGTDRTKTMDGSGPILDPFDCRFQILRKHRAGGIGIVYVALDRELNREVALKQMKPEKLYDPDSYNRFLVEAEVTGNLEHPGIVPVYGFGAVEGGNPYYAMRFLRGGTLKEAIAAFHEDEELKKDQGRRHLAMRALISQLVDVCHALGYAHGRNVVHRDIKPGNIVVGRHGETIVVDWGLAKVKGRAEPDGQPQASDDDNTLRVRSGSGSEETRGGSIFGTPEYMSPEQASGQVELHGPKSDIYSLGATLYCILTGRPPFVGTSEGIRRDVCAGRFRKPRERNASIDPALEAICLKAMALDPAKRHPTAESLADDLERWAADEPVSAWREPFWRRARRWARRHRTLAASLLVGLILTTTGLALGVYLINRERRVAEELFVTAHELAGSLVETSEQNLASVTGAESTRQALMLQAAEQMGKLADKRPGDAALVREAAAARFYLANMQRFFNRNADSEKSFEAAIRGLEAAAVLLPDDDKLRDLTAEAWRDRAALANRLGKLADADRMLELADGINTELLSRSPEATEFRRTRATILHARAEIAMSLGRDDEAERLSLEATTLFEALARQSMPDGKRVATAYATSASGRAVPLLWVMALNRHASTLGELGRRDEQIKRHEEALDLLNRWDDQKKTLDGRSLHVSTLAQLAKALTESPGKTPQAEKPAIEAIEAAAKLIELNSQSTAYREISARSKLALARVRAAQGRWDDARREAESARKEFEELTRKAVEIVRFAFDLGKALDQLSEIELASGNRVEAERLHREALEQLQRVSAAAPDQVPYARELKKVEGKKIPSAP